MKKLFLGVCALACIITSCSQDAMIEENVSDVLTTKSMQQETGPFFVEDGILHFNSVNDYFAFSDSITRFSSEELKNWETENNFTSYYTYVNSIIKEIDDTLENGNLDEYNSLLNEYSKYVYLSEDNEVFPRISLSSYQLLANKDGFFYVNGVKNMVVDNTISNGMTIYNYTNDVNKLTRSNVEEDISLKELEYKKTDDTKSILAACKLVRNIAFSTSQGDFTTQYQLLIQVRGKHKKKIGGWSTYETVHDVSEIKGIFQNIPVTVKSDGTIGSVQSTYTFIHDAMDRTKEEKYSTLTYNLGVAVKNYTVPMRNPICIHFKARCRGTQPEGLGYNYYRGCYDKTSPCPVHSFVDNFQK